MPRPEELYLADIVESCRHVTDFVSRVSFDDSVENALVQAGVLQKLTIIGEAARRLKPMFLDRYPAVPWRDLIAFRNLAVHDYFAVEWPLVWAIACNDVPVLHRQLRAILAADYPLLLAVLDQEPEA